MTSISSETYEKQVVLSCSPPTNSHSPRWTSLLLPQKVRSKFLLLLWHIWTHICSHILMSQSHTCPSTMFSYNVLFDLIHIFSWTGTTSAVSGPTVPSASGFAVEATAGVASCISTHITAIHSPQCHSFKSHSNSAWDFECHDLISCNGCMNLHETLNVMTSSLAMDAWICINMHWTKRWKRRADFQIHQTPAYDVFVCHCMLLNLTKSC